MFVVQPGKSLQQWRRFDFYPHSASSTAALFSNIFPPRYESKSQPLPWITEPSLEMNVILKPEMVLNGFVHPKVSGSHKPVCGVLLSFEWRFCWTLACSCHSPFSWSNVARVARGNPTEQGITNIFYRVYMFVGPFVNADLIMSAKKSGLQMKLRAFHAGAVTHFTRSKSGRHAHFLGHAKTSDMTPRRLMLNLPRLPSTCTIHLLTCGLVSL